MPNYTTYYWNHSLPSGYSGEGGSRVASELFGTSSVYNTQGNLTNTRAILWYQMDNATVYATDLVIAASDLTFPYAASSPNIMEILKQEGCYLFLSSYTAPILQVVEHATGIVRTDFDTSDYGIPTNTVAIKTSIKLKKNYYIKHTGDGSLREHWNNSVWSGTPEGFEYMTEAEFEAAFPIPEPEIPPYVEPEPDPRDVAIAALQTELQTLNTWKTSTNTKITNLESRPTSDSRVDGLLTRMTDVENNKFDKASITWGTADMVHGVTPLAEGSIYIKHKP